MEETTRAADAEAYCATQVRMNAFELSKSSAEPAKRVQRPSVKPVAANRRAAVPGESGSCCRVAAPPPASDRVVPGGGESGAITMVAR
jgi:hypothetical protein